MPDMIRLSDKIPPVVVVVFVFVVVVVVVVVVGPCFLGWLVQHGSILEENLHSIGSGVCIWENPLGLENGERVDNDYVD